jgi:hypothetical protein
MAYRTLDKLADGTVIKTTLLMLKDSGIKYVPEYLREENGFRCLSKIGQYLVKKKTKVRFEYVSSHREYDPFFDTHREYRWGYALMMYVNDIPAVCVRQNQDIPFTSLNKKHRSYQDLNVYLPKKIYKTISPGKELHGIMKIYTGDQPELFKNIYHIFKQLHEFNKKLDKGKDLLVTTDSSNYCYSLGTKVLDKKKRLREVRKQQLLLMGDKNKFILNPEWFTDEGIEPKEIQQHTVYLLTE